MSALTAQRRMSSLNDGLLMPFEHPTKATKVFYKGALVALDAGGFLVPASATAALRCAGVVDTGRNEKVDTTGQADGDTTLKVQAGVWLFRNGTAGDAIVQADVYKACYLLDDQTVAKTDGGVSRAVAGTVIKVVTAGIYVAVGYPLGLPMAFAESTILAGVINTASELVTSGAVSVVKRSTRLSVTGTVAYSLADGTVVGQRKTIRCTVAASTPAGTLTPAHPTGFATLAFSATSHWVELEWNGTAWELFQYAGVTIA